MLSLIPFSWSSLFPLQVRVTPLWQCDLPCPACSLGISWVWALVWFMARLSAQADPFPWFWISFVPAAVQEELV